MAVCGHESAYGSGRIARTVGRDWSLREVAVGRRVPLDGFESRGNFGQREAVPLMCGGGAPIVVAEAVDTSIGKGVL